MASGSSGTTVNANIHGTVNLVGHDQINQHFHFAPENTNRQPGLPRRINDAPIDRLSVNFTGRGKEFELLKEALNKRLSNLPSRCAIYGMPGVGKTQLLLQYAKVAFDNDWYSHIFWSSATTIDKLYQGFAKILDLVDDRGRFLQEQSAKLTSARLWLEGSHGDDNINWLLIVDNVHRDTVDFLRSNLPRGKTKGNILFTTRTAGLAEALANAAGIRYPVIKLETLSVKEGTNLLVDGAGIVSGTATPSLLSEAEELVKCVGRLPLAVVHAASFMKETGISLGNTLKLYNSEHKLEVIQWENDLNAYEERSVAATFTHHLNQLNEESRDISNLLKVLSFFDPESIPVEMVVQGARQLSHPQVNQGPPSNPPMPNATLSKSSRALTSSSPSPLSLPKRTPFQKLKEWSNHRRLKGHSEGSQTDDITPTSRIYFETQSLISLILSPIEFPKAIQKLSNLSLVEHRPNIGDSSLWIHDLVQFMTRESARTEESYQEWLQLSVSLACGAFQDIEDVDSPQSWPGCEKFMPHMRSLNEAWDDAYGMNHELVDAKTTMTIYLLRRGRYDEAEELCKQALEVRKKYLGSDHLNTLRLMHRLALVHGSQGRYDEAELLNKQVLVGREKVMGANHPDTLNSMHNLARVYESQGRYDEAEALYKQALASKEKVMGVNHPDTLASMNNLALVYQSQGRYEEAEALYKQVLAGKEKVIGANHPDTLTSMHNLAMVYNSQGRYDEAEALFKQVLANWERVIGANHPDTLASMHNLARAYESQGRHEEAEALYKQVLASQEEVIGANHPNTFSSMNDLAFVYQSQERYDEAAALYKAALSGLEKCLGRNHSHTKAIAHNLARLCQLRGQGNASQDDESLARGELGTHL